MPIINANSRPRDTDADTMAEVAQAMMPEIMQWGDFKEIDREDVLEGLTGVFQDSRDLDGYELAKKCDDELSWSADSSLVGILDGVGHKAYTVAKKKTEAWVTANGIMPAFCVGDHVKWQHGWKEQPTGNIVAVDAAHAKYTIQEDGKNYPASPGHPCGWIVEYEKVLGAVS